MTVDNGWDATTLMVSVGVIACLALQGLQTFVFAPLAGAEDSYFLVVIFLFVCVASIAVLSFLKMSRLAASRPQRPSSMPPSSPGYGGTLYTKASSS